MILILTTKVSTTALRWLGLPAAMISRMLWLTVSRVAASGIVGSFSSSSRSSVSRARSCCCVVRWSRMRRLAASSSASKASASNASRYLSIFAVTLLISDLTVLSSAATPSWLDS
ncbi:hypothetical protein BBK82_10815 [Lentzea guizhouensis]|uniref:Uncharacterized protein n=1 Tax=Lentzea guizhouensis TaxID=1586287 RepID=A0A1B2HFK4_9PSEU|nr:hypothetical protein BBK82_10815 [Lentzea guizhouensis]